MKNSLANSTLRPRSAAIWSGIRILAAITMFVWSAGERARAITIGIDLGTPPKLASQSDVSFDTLNGVSLNGQTLSLDFMFTNGEFARLFTATSSQFAATLTLQTGESGLVGFLGGTGELLDQQGNPLETPQDLGSASGNDDGSMHVVLSPLLSGQLQKPLDFFGVHYDLTLPSNPSVTISGSDFQLIAAGVNHDDRFGIGPGVPTDIVPDAGSTLFLFGLGLIVVLGIPNRTLFAR